MNSQLFDRISVDPRIHFGKPCVTGTWIPVQSVLELINAGISFEGIVAEYYPELSVADIHACMEYAIAVVAAEDIQLAPDRA